MNTPTYDQIKPYIEKGLISEQSHPEDADVRIFNYTQTCQFTQAWDEVTRQCRGLILNVRTGEVLARPFPKFFNYGEHLSKGWPIPDETPIVAEKLDGSLGILYTLGGKQWIATRGSFTSDQARWATDWWRTNHVAHPNPDPGVTHLFEIIYPENRIVVAYDFKGLIHLASIDNATGETTGHGFSERAKTIPTTDLAALAAMDEPNSEGFVAFFPKANVRVKIKFPEYVRLHRIVTGVSAIAIWEMLRDGKPIDAMLEKVPDEFFKWVTGVVNDLTDQFGKIEREAIEAAAAAKDKPTRKEQAAVITATRFPGVAFSILDEKNHKEAIWRMIRPRGMTAFKTDIDV